MKWIVSSFTAAVLLWLAAAAVSLMISPTPFTGWWLTRSSIIGGVLGFIAGSAFRGRRWALLLPVAYALWLLAGAFGRREVEALRLFAATAPAWAFAAALFWPQGLLADPRMPPDGEE